MPNPATPGGSHGQLNVGYVDKLHGLELAGTAKGSNELAILVTDSTITFEVDSDVTPMVGNGTLLDYVPLELHLQIIEAGVGVAGRWSSNLTGEGDASTTTIWHTLPATGDIINCYEHFAANATIWIRAEAAITSGTLSYKLRCARDS